MRRAGQVRQGGGRGGRGRTGGGAERELRGGARWRRGQAGGSESRKHTAICMMWLNFKLNPLTSVYRRRNYGSKEV